MNSTNPPSSTRRSPSPYRGRPPYTFWKRGVQGFSVDTVPDLYHKKFTIAPEDRIATAGSCFAQHISQELRRGGYQVLDAEPAPSGVSVQVARSNGYGVYSARYANLYCVRQLLQLFDEAMGRRPTPEDIVWPMGRRFADSLRPGIVPEGWETPEQVVAARKHHLERVRWMFENTDIMVFTFGLTEGWVSRETGQVYPTAPGTIAGAYDPEKYEFKNFTYQEILDDFLEFRDKIRAIRPNIRFIVTVSPVGLAATATNNHVMVATTYSKSVLRAVTGVLSDTCSDVDYFPSYELVTGQVTRWGLMDESLREVVPDGVSRVMAHFTAQHPRLDTAPVMQSEPTDEEIQCEEAILEVFAQ